MECLDGKNARFGHVFLGRSDAGHAAQAHLLAGRPVYYCCDDCPAEIIREWPDSRRELVSVREDGKMVNVRPIRRG